jgi:hypothetical protein
MSLSSWLRSRRSTRSSEPRSAARPAARFSPQLESLDDRLVPSTLIVTNNLGFGTGSLRDEIGQAQSGDVIVFDPGLNGQTIQLYSGPYDNGPIELFVAKNLTIQGPGADKLAIDANNMARAFHIAPGAQVAISGLTIKDGNGKTGAYDPRPHDYYGGGILNEGALTLSGCTVTGNTATDGPVVGFGGGVANLGTMTMTGCTVTGNAAGEFGGGVYNTGALTVAGSTVTHNTAYYAKYVDFYSTGTLSASHSTIGNKSYK